MFLSIQKQIQIRSSFVFSQKSEGVNTRYKIFKKNNKSFNIFIAKFPSSSWDTILTLSGLLTLRSTRSRRILS